ncbi:MAG: tRNA (adenosine(37)-N6)-dimethylallyltransferase MiaA [Saprospiraceae bacterium]
MQARDNNDNTLIVIAGPTGIGKTELACRLQSQFDCAILSADSRQVYKEMNIGTAKPGQQVILQHRISLCDYVSIHDEYNAGIFEKDALKLLDEEYSNKNVSIVCGGTGMYIKALLDGLDKFPEVELTIKSKWAEIEKAKGLVFLQEQIKKLDPEYAAVVALDNPRRLSRALAVIDQTGKKFSSFLSGKSRKRQFREMLIVLDIQRSELYKRIEERVDKMMIAGLLEEAEKLYPYKRLKALDTVGYKEIFAYMDGKCSLDEAVDQIKAHSRQYAKRQLSWNRKYLPGPRFNPRELDSMRKLINDHINDKSC